MVFGSIPGSNSEPHQRKRDLQLGSPPERLPGVGPVVPLASPKPDGQDPSNWPGTLPGRSRHALTVGGAERQGARPPLWGDGGCGRRPGGAAGREGAEL